MATSPAGRPTWQRNRVFKFFASLKLAVVLLAVLIVASIAGTIWESSFDAKVARAYIYGASWFNLWLILLATNLTVSALSRWPWKKHHVAFLITHLGIITLLVGSMIGRIWGTEGTITLFKGEPPTNRLLVDQHQLRVRDTDGIVKGYATEFINHPPTPQKPWDLGALASGARLSIVDYSTAVEGKLNPKPADDNHPPGLHFTIATAMMGQRLDSWLLADDGEHASFNMGLATIDLKRGTAPAASAGDAAPAAVGEVEIEESIFAFTKAPDQQVAKVGKGGNTGAKVVLAQPVDGNKGAVTISLGDKTWTHDVAAHLGRDTPLEGSSYVMRIEGYWPDFRIDNGKPATVSDQPNNPAVVVTLRGRGVPTAPAPNAHSGGTDPEKDSAVGAPNHLTLFIADDGAITYDLASRKAGRSTGKLELNTPLPTGWADWQLTVDNTMAHAEHWMDFSAIASSAPAANLPDGVRVRVQQGASTVEQWVPAGWQIALPTSPAPIQVAYGWKQEQLPIALELLEFEVQRNEGSDSPAGFKSTVRVTDRDGGSATGQCWMNNPFSYPGVWWRTWTGLTYKMSQASWNPENLGQSTIQILRDPGWLLKWIGSVLICTGIFMLFYLKGFRRPTVAAGNAPATRPKPRELAEAAN
ncbi:MAG: cytochrome c biogenesis protein ResB [Verrucomicrobiota bacterium]|nr:cytochrome c biogenesis protein ResB [Verrucomicrobiota bacterium]